MRTRAYTPAYAHPGRVWPAAVSTAGHDARTFARKTHRYNTFLQPDTSNALCSVMHTKPCFYSEECSHRDRCRTANTTGSRAQPRWTRCVPGRSLMLRSFAGSSLCGSGSAVAVTLLLRSAAAEATLRGLLCAPGRRHLHATRVAECLASIVRVWRSVLLAGGVEFSLQQELIRRLL